MFRVMRFGSRFLKLQRFIENFRHVFERQCGLIKMLSFGIVFLKIIRIVNAFWKIDIKSSFIAQMLDLICSVHTLTMLLLNVSVFKSHLVINANNTLIVESSNLKVAVTRRRSRGKRS